MRCEHRLRALDQLAVGRAAIEHRHQQVVDQRHLAEDARHLEGAADAGVGDDVRRLAGDALALDEDLAAIRPVEAADAIHQRRLAGAVDADDAQRLAGGGLQVDAVERHQAAEVLAEVAGLDGDGHRLPAEPRMPDGRTKIVPTRIAKPTICAMRLRQEHRRHLLGQAVDHAGDQGADRIAEAAQHHDDEADDRVLGPGERR